MTIADCTAPFALEVRFDAAADANSATINNRGEPFVFKIDLYLFLKDNLLINCFRFLSGLSTNRLLTLKPEDMILARNVLD